MLLNDDFASIVIAVRYGRRVFANLRKAIVFVVAVHVPIVGLSIMPVLLGWPMLLMPVHILFLQLIIDPACSVVFEAEPLEADAMTAPPRPRTARLFDRAVIGRGSVARRGTAGDAAGRVCRCALRVATSDDMARALMFIVLVLANLGLIYANRSWRLAAWRGGGASNATFRWIAAATLVMLALVLGIPQISGLFAFAAPTPAMLLAGAGVAVLALLWFEGVKWMFARRRAPAA